MTGKELVRLRTEFSAVSGDRAGQMKLIRKYRDDSKFCWLLQMVYDPIRVFPKFGMAKGNPQWQMPLSKLLDTLLLIRARSLASDCADDAAAGLIATYLEWPEHEVEAEILGEILTKKLFGLDVGIINEGIGRQFLSEVKIVQPAEFNPKFLQKFSTWSVIGRFDAPLVQVRKFGLMAEIFAKSGRPIRCLDHIRNAVRSIFCDGVFEGQLVFPGGMKEFFAASSGKNQAPQAKLVVHSYAPLSDLSDSMRIDSSAPKEMLANLFKNLEIISAARFSKLDQNKIPVSSYLLADDFCHSDRHSKRFMAT